MKNIIISSLVLWLLVFFIGCTTNVVEDSPINSFEECVAAGYPVMESYPEQCSDGENTFTRDITPDKELVLCTADWNPVCGIDGQTYSNQCNLDVSNIELDYVGECKENVILDSYGNEVLNSCQSWFDGCNNCIVSEDGTLACTRKYCPSESLGEAKCNN